MTERTRTELSSIVCRICLTAKSDCVKIFEGNVFKNAPNISEMISECTDCQVEKDDEFPQKVCMECAEALLGAYNIKRRAEQSYIELCKLYQKQVKNKRKTKLIIQLEKETQTGKVTYACKLCGSKYYDHAELQSHRRTEHQGVERNCRFCNKSFQLLRQLKSHLLQEHPEEYVASNLQCNVCNRRFSRRDHLKRHVQRVHKMKSMDHTANEDDKKVESDNDYDDEMMTEEAIEQPIDCIDIEKSLENWNDDEEYPAKDPIMSDSESKMLNSSQELNILSAIKKEPENDDREAKRIGNDDLENLVIKVELPLFESENENADSPSKFDTSGGSEHELLKSNSSVKRTKADNAEVKKPLIKKKRFHSVETSTNNRCDLCQRVFSRQCHLRRHMQSAHTDEKPHACKHCEKRFTRSDHLKMHILNVHEVKSHKCDMCEKAFVKNEALLRHKEVRHGDASGVYKIHECEFCKRKFTGKRYLARHRLLHTDRIFACRFCEATFKDRKQFREHERQHSSTQRNFLCSICGESFVRNDYLRVHMRRHLGEKPYKCQYCNKGFPRATDVKVHERYHTGTKPNVCQVCGKAFHRSYNLTIHMRIHTGEKPYKCDHCSKSFAQSNDLKAHIRRHTGERFKCQDCDASFLQLYGLRQHALSAHGTHIESSTGRLQKVGTLGLNNTIATITTPVATTTTTRTTETMNSITIEQDRNILQQKTEELNSFMFPPQQPNMVIIENTTSSAAQQYQTALPPSVALIYSSVPSTEYLPLK